MDININSDFPLHPLDPVDLFDTLLCVYTLSDIGTLPGVFILFSVVLLPCGDA